jgi:hypothetical protein
MHLFASSPNRNVSNQETTPMQSQNQIGTLAEKIVAVKINRHGVLTPILRRRSEDGRMLDCAGTSTPRHTVTQETEFVARVASGSNGLVTMKVNWWDPDGYLSPLIPVGSSRPFEDFDASSPAAGAPQSHSGSLDQPADEVRFRFVGNKLAWTNGETSGEMRIDESFPELTVALRLPPGNHGEICFKSPIFTTADGLPASVLAVA